MNKFLHSLKNCVLAGICVVYLSESALSQPNPDASNSDTKANNETLVNFLQPKKEVNYNQLFKEVQEKVKVNYVEDVNDKQLIESAMEGMLSSLDPHSGFLNEKEFEDMRITTKGEFGGVGIEVTMEKGFLKVISPYEDGPAFKSGVKIGDYITSVDGQVIKGMALSQAVEKLRGKPKSKVKVTVYRESSNQTYEFTITRELIKLAPVKASLINGDVAWLKITNFSENAASLLRKEYAKLIEKAKENKGQIIGIVLDLRWNPGGLLDQSKEVTELFLEDGIVVSTRGRVPESNSVSRASGHDITGGLPMVVLINGGSASASEIVAGALQDNKRAMIVGTKSFGKGSVQTIIPLAGNTAMKLTTSRYYTPSGRSIQAEGIEPDVVVEEALVTPVKAPDIGNEAALSGHLENDSAKKDDKNSSIKELRNSIPPSLSAKNDKEDYQLIRAVDIVKGMALYSDRLSD